VTVVEELYENDKELTVADESGRTALNLAAAFSCSVLVVRFLVDKGADRMKRNRSQLTAFMAACFHNRNLQIVQFLYTDERDLTTVDADENTALHVAAAFNQKEDECVATASFHAAVSGNTVQVVKFLYTQDLPLMELLNVPYLVNDNVNKKEIMAFLQPKMLQHAANFARRI